MGSPTIFAGNRTKFLTSRGAALKSGRTLDYDGVPNFIPYANFANGQTTGWSLCNVTITDNVPSTAPSAGASSIGTFAASTTTPLVQQSSYNLNVASSGAITQGHGFISDAFTIDRDQVGSVLSCSFSYEVLSGAANLAFTGTTTASFGVFLYDVTGAQWIQPAGCYPIVQSAGPAEAVGITFQTTGNTANTSYQLAIICVNATADAASLNFCNFYCGPQQTSYGPVISDWQAYTPSMTHASGGITNATSTAEWRRIGDQLEVSGSVVFSSTSASFTALYVSLPSGISIDTGKLDTTTSKILGVANFLDSGTQLYGPGAVTYNSTTVVTIGYASVKTHTGTAPVNTDSVTNTAPITFGANDKITYKFSVPITGWSSNQLVSSSASTAVVACRAFRNTNQTGVNPNNSSVKINIDTIDTAKGGDTIGAFDTANNRYVVRVPGWYMINGSIVLAGANVLATAYGAAIFINGSATVYGQTYYSASATGMRLTVQYFSYLKAGDYIELFCFGAGNNSSSTLTANAGTNNTFLEIVQQSGPAQIAATENISCKYTSSTTTIGTSATTVIMPTKVWDTHGIYNTSTGLATVPIAGEWEIVASLSCGSATGAIADSVTLTSIVNGTASSSFNLFRFQTTSALSPFVHGTVKVRLNAGDTVGITSSRSAGVSSFALTGSAASQFSLRYVGL